MYDLVIKAYNGINVIKFSNVDKAIEAFKAFCDDYKVMDSMELLNHTDHGIVHIMKLEVMNHD